jgi:DNA-binding NtrC family response regulator
MSLKRKKRILAIDDEPSMTEWLKILLEHAGYEVRTALIGNPRRGILQGLASRRRDHRHDAARHRRHRAGAQVQADRSGGEVIVITGQGNIPRSVEAVKAGAFDFLEKPIDAERLLDKLEKALKQKSLIDENEQLKAKLQDRYGLSNVVGKSKKMQDLFELIESVAASEANILIQGENGTGKELIANADSLQEQAVEGAVHQDQLRGDSQGPDRVGSCSATRRARSPARRWTRKACFEMAEGGSLLLDEIGEMPPYLQTKLLRVLQEREYRPIGSDRIVHVDFRLICATNIDLDSALREGRLREDLYFRINTITLRVPPLRERTEDIPLLCDYFLDKFRQRYQKNVRTLAPSVYHLLIRNRWPGNVRELENAIERAVLVAKGRKSPSRSARVDPRRIHGATDFVIPPHRTLAEIEKMAILQTLQRTNWNKQEAAQILGLYRPTLYSKMKKHDIRDAGKASRSAGRDGAHPADARSDVTARSRLSPGPAERFESRRLLPLSSAESCATPRLSSSE